MSCPKSTHTKDSQAIFLRDSAGEWSIYNGSTSLRKIYYKAFEAQRTGSSSFWVYEHPQCTGAIFPDRFYIRLRCSSINDVPVQDLPTRIILEKKHCKWIGLTGEAANICTHCGKKEYVR